ncbi:MAG TPA: ABC transporter ATP-binding protein [Candidatus Ornithoclostridium faecigallinarum]|nr:ABC transporter ATP-binding protein [Candidatus Ornithoclostridium faecigallinarum]
MLNHIMKKYALSRQGAKDLVIATISCVVHNLTLMLPVSLLYLLVADLYAGGVPQGHLWIYIVGMVAAVLLILFSYRWVYGATYYATYKESSVRRISLAEKLRKLPLSFFGKRDLSDLTTTIMADCTTLEQSFSHWIPEFFGSMISTVIVAVCLFIFDWRLALAALWVLPVSLAIVAFSGKVQNYFTRRQTEAKLAVAEGIQEALETMRDLKSNNAEEKYLKGLDEKIDLQEKRMIASELGGALFVVPAGMILKLGIGTVALVGGMLLASNAITVLTFFMYLLVVSRLYDPLSSSLQNLAAIISTNIPIERMNEIENYPVQPGTAELKTQGYDIKFDNVSFAYNTGEQVLSGVSFTAKQGEVTALIGPSGGGKSTAAKLAARFWDADSGKITLGGTDVKTVDPEKLLSAYSIVFQDVTLFNNTVMENIRIGRQGATDEEVLAAAREAQCDEFVEKLPEGYQTMIGENGSALSGGERQRISIARALLKDSPVILLDEATASLDAENETHIQRAISRLVKGKTVLIIAHRMRTVEGADKLVLLKDGKVAEQGSPEELLAKGGIYAKMCQLQQQSGEWRI